MSSGPTCNPYEVRTAADLRQQSADDLKKLTIVGTILLSMAMMTFALYLGGLAFNLAMGVRFEPPPGLEQGNQMLFRTVQIGSTVLGILFQLLVIAGSVAMIARKWFWLAWTGAIIGLVPFCGPCIGLAIPFAIWSMVLLQRPAVLAAFAANKITE
jgi:hypothetical protein